MRVKFARASARNSSRSRRVSRTRICTACATASLLPLQPDTATRNVELQSTDPRSLLNRWRELLALRRATPALQSGGLEGLERDGDRISWRRVSEDQTVEVYLNLGARPRRVETRGGLVAFSNQRERAWIEAGEAVLAGDEALILVR